jgi:hypothetical protein
VLLAWKECLRAAGSMVLRRVRTAHVGPGEDDEGGAAAAQLHIVGHEAGARRQVQPGRGVPQGLRAEHLPGCRTLLRLCAFFFDQHRQQENTAHA